MLFFQILICAYVVFLIWDLFQIVTRARPAWNRKAVALALTLFLVPGMYKYSLYFPFVVYILVFTLLVQLLTRVLKKPFRLWMVALCVAAAFSYTAYSYTHFQRRVEMDYALETDKKIAPTRLLFFFGLALSKRYGWRLAGAACRFDGAHRSGYRPDWGRLV